MDWSDLFIVLLVSHLAGDFLLQTEWQAVNKVGGLGRDPERRRALALHVLTYGAAYGPAAFWVADQQGVRAAGLLAATVLIPHYLQDDGRVLRGYVKAVKKSEPPVGSLLWVGVDQSFHIVALLGAALLVGLAL